MAPITGTEPRNWHAVNDDGMYHRLKDPRSYRGYPRRRWTAEEQAYVAHLEAHEQGHLSLDPLGTDPELVRVCLDHIANEEIRLATLRALVFALRQDLTRGVSVDESEVAGTLAMVLAALHGDVVQPGGNGEAEACTPA